MFLLCRSAVYVCVCVFVGVYQPCVGVHLYTQRTTTGPFPHLLLKSTRLSLSGHSFFPGFHPIVFKEKGLVAHPQPAGRLHSVLIAWERQGVRGGVGGLQQCITHWWSESVNQRGWHIVQDGQPGGGQGTRSRLRQTLQREQSPLLLPLLLSHFIFCSSHLSPHQMNWACFIPVLKPSFC